MTSTRGLDTVARDDDTPDRSGSVQMRPATLALSPVYRHLRDSILRPHLRITESRYFWERWKPRLGADATVLIMEVRDRCNRSLLPHGDDRDAGRSGGDCTVGATELAAACGFSRVTLWRILQREEVRKFVWVEHNYVYDRAVGKRRRTISTYHVLMEDPLIEDDEAYVQGIIQAGEPLSPMQSLTFLSATKVVEPPPLRVQPAQVPSFQPATEVTRFVRPTVHSGTTTVSFSLKPQNVSETNQDKRSETAERTDTQPHVDVVKTVMQSEPQVVHEVLPGPHDASAPKRRPTAYELEVAAIQAASDLARGLHAEPAPYRLPDQTNRVTRAETLRKGVGNSEELAPFIEHAERVLGDRHSRGFYVTALRRLYPDHMPVWHRALGLAAEQAPETIRRSRGALFTSLLRSFAGAAGVSLAAPPRRTS